MKGPRPKPTALKLVTGNPGRRPLNTAEPKPRGALLHPPEHLTEAQRVGWTYVIAHAPPGLLKVLDRAALTVFVIAEERHAAANIALATGPMLMKTVNGNIIQSPYMAVLNKQGLIMLKAAAEMGFTPSSRTRVETNGEAPEPDEFFGYN